ncbi:MAG TPA: alanine racemase [Terriglobia bacterium]|nr:alanine racemase [Terriglobia bacterium]
MQVDHLSTPALVVDLDVLERNLDGMAHYCREHGLGLRPHTKTHKTLEVSRMQLERGAVGLTVAKAGEAEVMAAAEPAEMLVAYPIYGAEKLRRLAGLARSRRILLSLDSEVTASELSAAAAAQGVTFGVLVEFDTGLHRCGLAPGPDCLKLAEVVRALPGLEFRGLMTYPGSIGGAAESRTAEARRVSAAVEIAIRSFEGARIPVEIVSAGSTPSAWLSHEIKGVTEIRPGTYVYNDLNTYYQGLCSLEDCAARVVTTVISTAVPGRMMLDAGSKTLSSDLLSFGPKEGYGRVVEAPEATLFKLNEEHGHVDISHARRAFKVGDVLTLIPNHVCTCVNMHDELFLARRGEVCGSWRIAARGKIR